ncbi:protein AF1q [Antennarius striatus]|uniref:protein AF1q n=1 Tax=Antennarius striatus TaxID=241820 RepID=UPI0035AE4E5F
MMEKPSSQFDSFLFWRQPIPALDLSELQDLGLTDSQPAHSVVGRDRRVPQRGQEDEDLLSEFSSFNYWKAPIADIDALLADLNLLL